MPATDLHSLLAARRSRRDFSDRPVPLERLHRLIWAAQGITDAEGRRTAPSAHALHPLHLLLVAGRVEALDAGLYGVEGEKLYPVASGDLRPALQAAAIDKQPWIGAAAALLTFTADLAAVTEAFADQPPHGERGARYLYMEAGAAAQNALLQAEAEGLGAVLVAGIRDDATAAALGLAAPGVPLLHLCLGWPA